MYTISNPPSHNIVLTDLLVLFISVLVHRLRILSDLHRDELLALKRASGPQAEAFWIPPVWPLPACLGMWQSSCSPCSHSCPFDWSNRSPIGVQSDDFRPLNRGQATLSARARADWEGEVTTGENPQERREQSSLLLFLIITFRKRVNAQIR